jgi:hypothetical protein
VALEGFESPAKVLAEAEKLATAGSAKVDAARTVVKEQHLEAQNMMPPTGLEKFFDTLAKGADRIPEAASCKKLTALKDRGIGAEHARLLCQCVQKGGASKQTFLSFAQIYYAVVKDIAFADTFEVDACKTLGKAEKDEIVEIMDGPTNDEKLGLMRVKAKSLLDGVEGWMTLEDNQGTPFMKKVVKPSYVCLKDLMMKKGLMKSYL